MGSGLHQHLHARHQHRHEHDDRHDDRHDHHHSDGPGPEGPLGPSGEASVVLDIGPHAGALVLYTDAELAGSEIEIRPGGGTWLGTHTAVRARHVGSGVLHAGVFGSLAAGTYDVRLKGGGPRSFDLTVVVEAGSVTQQRILAPAQRHAAPGVPLG